MRKPNIIKERWHLMIVSDKSEDVFSEWSVDVSYLRNPKLYLIKKILNRPKILRWMEKHCDSCAVAVVFKPAENRAERVKGYIASADGQYVSHRAFGYWLDDNQLGNWYKYTKNIKWRW